MDTVTFALVPDSRPNPPRAHQLLLRPWNPAILWMVRPHAMVIYGRTRKCWTSARVDLDAHGTVTRTLSNVSPLCAGEPQQHDPEGTKVDGLPAGAELILDRWLEREYRRRILTTLRQRIAQRNDRDDVFDLISGVGADEYELALAAWSIDDPELRRTAIDLATVGGFTGTPAELVDAAAGIHA